MIQIETETYTRITRRTAEKLFNAGYTIYLLPCKMNPASPWACPAGYRRAQDSKGFSALVAAFTWYNCTNEAGLYPAYYIEK